MYKQAFSDSPSYSDNLSLSAIIANDIPQGISNNPGPKNDSDNIQGPNTYDSNNIENNNEHNEDVNEEQYPTSPETKEGKQNDKNKNDKNKEVEMICFHTILKVYLPKFKEKSLNNIKIIEEIEIDIHKGIKTTKIVENIEVNKIFHDKNFNVNLIKRIKHFMYNEYLLIFFMNLLNLFGLIRPGLKFQRLEHNKIIKEDNRSVNLRFLDMTIIEFLSQNPFNKQILLRFKKDDNNIISIFISNMVVKDYVDIFTFKKELEELDYATNLGQEKIEEIKKIFKRADTLLKKVFNKSNGKEKKRADEDDKKPIKNNSEIEKNTNRYYYSIFLFYLINFRYYYESKKERKKKKKKIYEIKKTTRPTKNNGH